jgi:PAS domain S-box-containing protein
MSEKFPGNRNLDEEILRLRGEVAELKNALDQERRRQADSDERHRIAALRFKQAEASAKESRERLAFILQGLDMGSWDWNIQTGEIVDDKHWLEMLGYHAGEIESNTRCWEELFHPDDVSRIGKAFYAHAEGMAPFYEGEYRVRHKSGSWVRVLDKGKIIERDSQGKPLRATGVHINITNRRQTEKALLDSERRFRSLVETTSDWVWEVNADGVYTYVSPRIRDLLGYEPEEVVGKTPFDLMPKDEAERVSALFRDIAESQKSFAGLENVNLHKDGREIVLETNGVPFGDAQGKFLGYRGIDRDITYRKRAEERLRASEKLLNDILDASPIPQFVIDRDHRIIQWNKALEDYSGIRADDIVGTDQQWRPFYREKRPTMADLLAGGEVEKIPEWFAGKFAKSKLVEGAYEATGFFPAMGKDGKWLYFTASAIKDSNGSIVGAVETLEDITERKQAEESLHRLNRELRAISDCNQTLVRAEDEQSLLNDVCHSICDKAGYRMAWVGYAEKDDAKTVRPVAWAGFENGYLADANITWAETEHGRGPTGTAIRSGKSVCIQDFIADLRAAPWREKALQRGYRSSIALPLRGEQPDVFGALTIYSSMPDSFTSDEIRLLEELAGDLAFGINVLRTRVERKRAEEALKEREEFLSSVVENIPHMIFIKDGKDLKFIRMNRAGEELRRMLFAKTTERCSKADSSTTLQRGRWKQRRASGSSTQKRCRFWIKRGNRHTFLEYPKTSPSANGRKRSKRDCGSSWSKPRRWIPSAAWPAAWPTISTTCST